ncbi:hypothetical protein [Aliiroseovarius marinus]|uniref:hypothetical protein n=1 Tax=Aliiroseovarius marinus TaxID=2500159 RepID=UPI002493E4C3|nr:hypothetical protein [Aliiroseovarius marinus]
MITNLHPENRYLIVTPLLTECERIVAEARIPFQQPEIVQSDPEIETKKDHLIQLLWEKKNVVTTHAMFDNLSDVARDGLLDEYDLVIDEVMSVVDDGYRVKQKTWEQFYIGNGYVTVHPDTGQITPTDRWEDDVEQVDDALSVDVFKAAKAGRLYHLRDGINLAVMPEVLLKAGRSLTVYTFKAEGSLMKAYLERLGLDPVHDTGGPEVEREFIRKARDLITVKRIPALEGLKLSHSGQTKSDASKLDVAVPKALRSLRQNGLSEIQLSKVLITTPKEKWFWKGKAPTKTAESEGNVPFKPGPYAKNSRLVSRQDRAKWIPNTTRGTNDYRDATHLIYIYDQFLNPNIQQWFGGADVISHDDYALTELIQVIWRTQVRDDKPITVYIPSERMRELFLNWLWEGQVPTEVRDEINRSQGRR